MNPLFFYYFPNIICNIQPYANEYQPNHNRSYSEIPYCNNASYFSFQALTCPNNNDISKTAIGLNQQFIVQDTKSQDSSIKNNIKEQKIDQSSKSPQSTFEHSKTIQSKTKDLMRPFVRMIYRFYQKLLSTEKINSFQKKQLFQFNNKVDQLRSKNPCRFTDLMIDHLKSISCSIRNQLQNYLFSVEFCEQIQFSDCFKHWKDKKQLINFLKQFVSSNHSFLKPTKFYKLEYKKLI